MALFGMELHTVNIIVLHGADDGLIKLVGRRHVAGVVAFHVIAVGEVEAELALTGK